MRHLTHDDRIVIETMLNRGSRVVEIAQYIGVSRNTIYEEIKRGKYVHRNSDWTETIKYSADLGQKKHDWNAQALGRPLKIGNDIALADYIEARIAEDKYSPEAAIMSANESGLFSTTLSTPTIYRYIDKGIFLHITNKDLPVKGRRRRKYHRVRVAKRMSAGTSIEKRPKGIDSRQTFGHWEMDTVKGKRGVSKSCLLVLTERQTRDEIIAKMPDQTSQAVVDILDRLERKWGAYFPKVFQTITVDNGVEFADVNGMERSIHGGQRTKVYYCHPYSSWERGSNETQNKLIRRHIPKGADIDNVQDGEVSRVEKWINEYPRRHQRKSATLFAEALINIGVAIGC